MNKNEDYYIKSLKKGRDEGIDYVVDTYGALIKGTVYKVLGCFKDEGLIEECMNDVFLSLWDNSSKFNGEAVDFKKWVFTVSKFRAIDYYRKQVRKFEIASESYDGRTDKSPEDEIMTKEVQEEVLGLMDSLEAKDKEILTMKFFLGYKNEEIASKLGITKAAVDNRIYRGKRKLKDEAMKINLEVV